MRGEEEIRKEMERYEESLKLELALLKPNKELVDRLKNRKSELEWVLDY